MNEISRYDYNRSENEPHQAPIATSSVSEMRRVFGVNVDRLRNAVEVLACRILERKLETCIEVCHCQQCIEDIYCLAMNRTPPLYYHSEKNFAQRLKDQGPPRDILQSLETAIDHAIVTVGQNPSHD
ncbi:MAG: late competence development ComFB family protein [Acidobacteriota bacterium]